MHIWLCRNIYTISRIHIATNKTIPKRLRNKKEIGMSSQIIKNDTKYKLSKSIVQRKVPRKRGSGRKKIMSQEVRDMVSKNNQENVYSNSQQE